MLSLTEICLGRLLETFVVAQIRAEVALMSPSPRLHHLRTAEGRNEIDLVIEVGPRALVAIEIKATSTPDPGDAKHLRWFRRELGEAVRAHRATPHRPPHRPPHNHL